MEEINYFVKYYNAVDSDTRVIVCDIAEYTPLMVDKSGNILHSLYDAIDESIHKVRRSAYQTAKDEGLKIDNKNEIIEIEPHEYGDASWSAKDKKLDEMWEEDF